MIYPVTRAGSYKKAKLSKICHPSSQLLRRTSQKAQAFSIVCWIYANIKTKIMHLRYQSVAFRFALHCFSKLYESIKPADETKYNFEKPPRFSLLPRKKKPSRGNNARRRRRRRKMFMCSMYHLEISNHYRNLVATRKRHDTGVSVASTHDVSSQ